MVVVVVINQKLNPFAFHSLSGFLGVPEDKVKRRRSKYDLDGSYLRSSRWHIPISLDLLVQLHVQQGVSKHILSYFFRSTFLLLPTFLILLNELHKREASNSAFNLIIRFISFKFDFIHFKVKAVLLKAFTYSLLWSTDLFITS